MILTNAQLETDKGINRENSPSTKKTLKNECDNFFSNNERRNLQLLAQI